MPNKAACQKGWVYSVVSRMVWLSGWSYDQDGLVVRIVWLPGWSGHKDGLVARTVWLLGWFGCQM
jgi:ribosome modulation factor